MEERALSFRIVLFVLTVEKGLSVVISTKLDSAVNFHLPSYQLCGSYSLNSNFDMEVMSVVNSTHVTIATNYKNRGTITPRNNEVVFTLHHVTKDDVGRYHLRRGARLLQTPGCDEVYDLTLEEDLTTRSQEQGWGSWSDCDAGKCGYGRRVRGKIDGSDREQERCYAGRECEWGGWSGWSACGGQGCMKGRQRYCMAGPSEREEDVRKCGPEEYVTHENCRPEECSMATNAQAHWSYWTEWNTCSQSCGTGTRLRSRDCLDARSSIIQGRCTGDREESEECKIVSCEGTVTEAAKASTDVTVKLPLSSIVGGAAGLFIFILVIVIIVLVVKLRKRRPRDIRRKHGNKGKRMVESIYICSTHCTTDYREVRGFGLPLRMNSSRDKGNSDKAKKYKKKVTISTTSVSGFHCYDEIDDDDVKSDKCYVNDDVKKKERTSVLTIDNTYVSLPQSASPTNNYSNQTIWNSVTYNNEQKSVFMYGDAPGDAGNKEDDGHGNGNKMAVPRHMSVDSVGYLMPGTPEERARNKKYTKN